MPRSSPSRPRRGLWGLGTRLLTVASAVAVAGALVGAGSAAASSRAGQFRPLPNSPVSGSVLVARALHSGAWTLPARTSTQPSVKAKRLPNVQASEGGQPVNEDPIVANPTNPSQLESGGNDYNCPTLQGFYNSSNKGSTWSHYCMAAISGASGEGDPTVGYDLNGNAYIGGIQTGGAAGSSAIVFQKSSDNGATWSPTAIAVSPYYAGGLTDKDWMEIDTNASSPYKNCIYISVTQFNGPETAQQITVSHSCNGGSTWSAPIAVGPVANSPTVNQFTDLAVGKDGTVYVSYMTCTATGPTGDCGGTQATMYMSKSTDGGNTWSTPTVITQPNLAPDTCGDYYGTLPNTCERVSDIPVIAVDNSSKATSGNLYVVTYNWTGSFMQVQVSTSTNGGATWTTQAVAPTETHDQFFPWLNVSPGGVVGVTWLDRQADPANLEYNAVAAVSVNGGSSYRGPAKVSTVMSNPNDDGFGGLFMGDYSGNAFDGSGSLYQSWMDTRTGVSQDETGGFSA